VTASSDLGRETPAQTTEPGDLDPRTTRRLLVAITGLALLVRLPGLDAPLWFDEVWTLVDFVRRPLSETASTYPSDNHHPLFTLLAGLSVRAFGESPWALRLPALVFGVGAVPLVALLGRRLVGTRAALVAALFLALSAHVAAYAQNARGYSALLFFVLAATYGFLKALEGGGLRSVVLAGVALALATFAHLTAVLSAVAFLVCTLMAATGRLGSAVRWRAGLACLVLATVVSLALHAPMLPELFDYFVGGGRGSSGALEAEWTSPLWALRELGAALFGRTGTTLGVVALGIGLALGLLGLVRIARSSRAAALVFLLVPLLTAGALLLLGRNLWPRLFFQGAGFACLVCVAALAPRPRGLLPRALAFVALLVVGVGLAAPFPRLWSLPKQDFRAAWEYVRELVQPGDRCASVGLASFPYEAFYGGDVLAVDSVGELEAASAEADRLFVLTTFPIYLHSRHPDVAAWLDEHAVEEARFPGWVGDGDVVVLRVR